jgi:hypothetical protein
MKTSPTTSSSLRWLFRLRDSDELSVFSYWAFAVATALVGFILVSLAWPRAVAFYTDAEYKDWIASPHPRALAAAGEGDSTFKKRLDDIIAAIEHDNPGQVGSAPLFEAAAVRRGGTLCDVSYKIASDRPQSFGEVPVFPKCVTFARGQERKLSTEEDRTESYVFNNFASYIVPEFAKQPRQDSDPNHTEHTLATTLGLSDDATGSSFDVPWVYVSSQSGSIAVFPGTTVIADSSWKASSRPWWQETFGGQLHLGSDGLWQVGDRVTVTYLDILTNTPIHVRTYLRKFKRGPEEFVVAIDLYHRDDQPLRALGFLGIDIARPSLQLRLGFTLTISVIFFALVRWVAPPAHQRFIFERGRSIYGNLTAQRLLDFLNEDEAKAARGWKISLGKDINAKVEAERQQRQAALSELRLSGSVMCRGFEKWVVSHQTYRSWRLLGRFASIAKTDIGEIELTYDSGILPKAEWRPFNDRVFSKRDEEYYEKRLLEVLLQNADTCKKRLETPATREELQAFATAAEIPEWVRTAVLEPQQLSATRQRRAYITLDDAKLGQLYERANGVRAVILLSYFEHLFHRHQTDFLLKGKTVNRLVCFPTQEAELQIGQDLRLIYDELRTSSRTLKRVNATIDRDDSPKPVYDFAIIETGVGTEDKWLIVTHAVSETKLVDRDSSREGPATYRVDCYISWRTSDISFYEAIFADLNGKSEPMPPIGHSRVHTA